ncbi:MAG: Fur family transcriptional regulator [Desulfuromonas thiophila]|nr:Fur family transcriptional regulator [Desulfuromonas thiophila]MDY0398341.1 Fur family transcriptional regulator [Desulfuromonas thiophila]
MSQQLFEQLLEEHCLKATAQRRDIYAEILAMDEHFDVDTLLFRLKDQGKRISKATIYRTLQLLLEYGLIKKTPLSPDGAEALYGACPEGCPSDNLVCVECGKVVCFNKDDVCRLCHQIAGQHGFVASSHCLNIFALCPACQQRQATALEGEPSHAQA